MLRFFSLLGTFSLFMLNSQMSQAQTLTIIPDGKTYQIRLEQEGRVLLTSPSEGLWSIATQWKKDWPAQWWHAQPDSYEEQGPWKILSGQIQLPSGILKLQDAYRQEEGRIKCIRRFEWAGEEALKTATLSARWIVPATQTQAFLPGILYYGNPSGEKNGKQKVPVFHGQAGEMAMFEEHRFPMPFASVEWESEEMFHGASLHSIPSQISGGNLPDQWWSLGVEAKEAHTELLLLSGPITYNDQKSVAKALQRSSLPYPDAHMTLESGAIIEKSFFLSSTRSAIRGTSFQEPIYTSIDIFQPFYLGDLPTYEEILESKYRFAKSRWIEGDGYAGFNMYPEFRDQVIVLGWAGQSEAPVYALQALASRLKDEQIWDMVQRSMDHICTSPIGPNGFPVRYAIKTNTWERPDPVSEGQAMNSIALGIREGRKNRKVRVGEWENFLQKACDVHVKRILSEEWNPVNTAEAFYISPLLLAAQLFDNQQYEQAALKAAEYYAHRHLDMQEPYWGGTLDATCEDKEGAWGAFQGFLAAYEYTRQEKYLLWAKHAGDVTLSYTVLWDIPLPAGRMADHFLKTRGWTGVSAQNQHLDVYGVLIAPSVYKLGMYLHNKTLQQLAKVMYRSCGQMIRPDGAHGEQLQQTNYTQWTEGKAIRSAAGLRGGYSEDWTVFWITAHFLHAAAQFEEMGVDLDE